MTVEAHLSLPHCARLRLPTSAPAHQRTSKMFGRSLLSASPQKTIGERSRLMLERFLRIAERPDSNLDNQPTAKLALEDEYIRFKLWAYNIGVFAEVQLSLDYRIRELPEVKDQFLGHLDTIESRLDQSALMRPYIFALTDHG
jgi:hypothetical protein